MATCRSCGAQIVWAVTEAGKRMPVDPEPSPDGNVELIGSPEHPRAVVHGTRPLFGPPLHLAHFVTCTNWRR
jgi:hypothetical protein